MKIFFIPFLLVFMSQAAFSESEGGNSSGGGDLALCKSTDANAFEGLYSLDYLATFRSSNDNQDIIPIKTWEQSKQRVLGLLKAKSPMLAGSFQNFLNSMSNFDDYSKLRIWEESSFGLVDIKDEKLFGQLPKNCYIEGEDGGSKLIQAVIRTQRPNLLTYEFADPYFKELKEKRPLQYSFLIVHEWLRDFTEDVQNIRRLNRIIHSDFLEKSGASDLDNIVSSFKLTPLPELRLGHYESDQPGCSADVFWYNPNPTFLKFTIFFPEGCGKEYQGYMMLHNYFDCTYDAEGAHVCTQDDPRNQITGLSILNDRTFLPSFSGVPGLEFHWIKDK